MHSIVLLSALLASATVHCSAINHIQYNLILISNRILAKSYTTSCTAVNLLPAIIDEQNKQMALDILAEAGQQEAWIGGTVDHTGCPKLDHYYVLSNGSVKNLREDHDRDTFLHGFLCSTTPYSVKKNDSSAGATIKKNDSSTGSAIKKNDSSAGGTIKIQYSTQESASGGKKPSKTSTVNLDDTISIKSSGCFNSAKVPINVIKRAKVKEFHNAPVLHWLQRRPLRAKHTKVEAARVSINIIHDAEVKRFYNREYYQQCCGSDREGSEAREWPFHSAAQANGLDDLIKTLIQTANEQGDAGKEKSEDARTRSNEQRVSLPKSIASFEQLAWLTEMLHTPPDDPELLERLVNRATELTEVVDEALGFFKGMLMDRKEALVQQSGPRSEITASEEKKENDANEPTAAASERKRLSEALRHKPQSYSGDRGDDDDDDD